MLHVLDHTTREDMLREQERLRKNVKEQLTKIRADATPNKASQTKRAKAQTKKFVGSGIGASGAVEEDSDDEGDAANGLPDTRLKVSL